MLNKSIFRRVKVRINKKILEILGMKISYNYYLDNPLWSRKNVNRIALYSDVVNIKISDYFDKSVEYQYCFPKRYVYELENVIIDPLHNLIYDENGVLIAESSAWEYQRLLYETFQPKIKNYKNLNIKKGTYIFMQNIPNYYHWLIEDLPPFINSWNFVKEKKMNYKILIGRHYNFPPIKDFFNKYLKEEKCEFINYLKPFRVERLIFTAKTGGMGNPFGSANIAHPKDIKLLRSFFDEYISQENPIQKIYMSRSKAKRRKLIGEEKIDKFFEDKGFKIFYGNLSLFDQIKLFSKSNLAVGPTGASMTNIIWMPKKAKFIDLHYKDKIFPFFYNLAQFLDIDYKYLEIPSNELDEKMLNEIFVKIESFLK